MAKVIICCSQGASSSFLVGRLNDHIAKKGLDISVTEATTDIIMGGDLDFDVILVAPQIRGQVGQLKAAFPDKGVSDIDFRLYSGMQPQKVVDLINSLLPEEA